jgi:hypothetical protein
MRFLNTERLVVDLARGQVTESGCAEYYLGNTVLWTLWGYYSLYMGLSSRGFLFFVECGAVLIVTVLGVASCYRANGGADGRDFMVRANCLAFPIAVKLNAISVALGWLNYFYFFRVFDERTFHSPERLLNLLLFLWGPVFVGLFYWRLSVRLRAVRRLSEPNSTLNKDAPNGGAPVS